MLKRILKIFAGIIGVLIITVGGYLIYAYSVYYRVPDDKPLTIHNSTQTKFKVNQSYHAMTYNIGYGSYPPSYSFFMDGGKKSIADSKSSVEHNINGVITTTKSVNPDVAFYQEVDESGERSRNVNERKMIANSLSNYGNIFGQNYDSPYLFYPLNQPIGKAKSGILTLSKMKLLDSTRYSLPIDTNFNKFLDLDRAFTLTRTPVNNGKQLVLINVHLSAYTKSKKVQKAQLNKLFHAMAHEYSKGNYVIVGGDYNHDTLGNSPTIFKTSKENLTWTHPFPKEQLPKGFSMPTRQLAKAAVPSARNLNAPYKPGKSFVTLIDGFIVSKNVSVQNVQVKNTNFAYSDHNPIHMSFKLSK